MEFDLVEAILDALGNLDLAFAGQQLDRPHLSHVHAYGVCRAAEFGIHAGERRFGFLGGFLVSSRCIGQRRGLGLRRLFIDRDAHIVDHVDDILDLFGIDNVVWQVVVDLDIGQVTLLFASGNQILQLLSLLAHANGCLFFTQDSNPYG